MVCSFNAYIILSNRIGTYVESGKIFKKGKNNYLSFLYSNGIY